MLNASRDQNEQVPEKGKKQHLSQDSNLPCLCICFFFNFKGPLRGANSLIRPIKLRHFAAPLNGDMGPLAF